MSLKQPLMLKYLSAVSFKAEFYSKYKTLKEREDNGRFQDYISKQRLQVPQLIRTYLDNIKLCCVARALPLKINCVFVDKNKLAERYNHSYCKVQETENTQSSFAMMSYTLTQEEKERFRITPQWNYSEVPQIMARAVRLGSHNDLIRLRYKI